jgi:hypothetical protein
MSADKNFESHASENGTVIENRIIPTVGTNPLDYSDILKFSNCTDILVDNCEIKGGKEDCIDIVRGVNYTIKNSDLYPVHNGITIKGSVDSVNLNNIVFKTHGKDCDIELGQYDNYWYVGRQPTRNILIHNIKSEDEKPVVIKIWDACTPAVENSNVRIIKIPKLIWFPYFVFRAIQTRGIKNIFTPVGSNTFIKTK